MLSLRSLTPLTFLSVSVFSTGLVLGGGTLASAQPVKVKLETRSLPEGRPGTIRVLISRGAGDTRPVLLVAARLEVSQRGAPTLRSGGSLLRTVHGLSLETSAPDAIPGLESDDDGDGDRVVSFELRAVDDPGPAARQPLPDVVSTARGEPHHLVPLLARRTETRDCLPLAGVCSVKVSWEAIVLPKETPAGVYELARVQNWLPEEESRKARTMGPRKLFRLTTRHWREWRGEQRGELLLRKEAFAKLPVYRGTLTKRIRIRPAAFSRAAAEAKAKLQATRAWRLPDNRWILQRSVEGEQSFALVGARQKPLAGNGDLSLIARDLAEGRKSHLRWSDHRSYPDLSVTVKEFFQAGFSKSRALTWSIDAEQLAPFLEEVGETKVQISGRSLRGSRTP